MDSTKIAIVILNWNGEELLKKFLPSAVEHNELSSDIFLVDNASTDNSVNWVIENYPKIKIIQLPVNSGFAEGYNLALKEIKADYFVLLNSDVEVSENWISPIISLMESDTSIAVCQPKIRSFKNKNSFEYAGAAGGYIDRFGYPFCKGRVFESLELDQNQYVGNHEVFWASGAAFFIRANLFKLSGGFDKDFFAHMEEIDLCWRLKNMGYKIMSCGSSTIYHLGGGTLSENSAQKTFLNFRNSLYTLRKNLPLHSSFGILFLRHFLDLIAMLKFLLSGKWKLAFAINRAHYDFLFSQHKFARKRKEMLKLFKTPNKIGYYNRSIVFDYFILKKKKFSDLTPRNFFGN